MSEDSFCIGSRQFTPKVAMSPNISQENLTELPLARMRGGLAPINKWFDATEEERNMAAVCMQRADLSGAQLQRANLSGAQLQRAHLMSAQLQQASLMDAQLQQA
jgi:uncharacterized protein YjbI with pentapeptide repeats